jgi:hypothetical protein
MEKYFAKTYRILAIICDVGEGEAIPNAFLTNGGGAVLRHEGQILDNNNVERCRP